MEASVVAELQEGKDFFSGHGFFPECDTDGGRMFGGKPVIGERVKRPDEVGRVVDVTIEVDKASFRVETACGFCVYVQLRKGCCLGSLRVLGDEGATGVFGKMGDVFFQRNGTPADGIDENPLACGFQKGYIPGITDGEVTVGDQRGGRVGPGGNCEGFLPFREAKDTDGKVEFDPGQRIFHAEFIPESLGGGVLFSQILDPVQDGGRVDAAIGTAFIGTDA